MKYSYLTIDILFWLIIFSNTSCNYYRTKMESVFHAMVHVPRPASFLILYMLVTLENYKIVQLSKGH